MSICSPPMLNTSFWGDAPISQSLWAPSMVGNFYVNPQSPRVCELHPRPATSMVNPLMCGSSQILLGWANFYVSGLIQSCGLKTWKHSQLRFGKFKPSTVINRCPGFLGNSWQKKLDQKTKGLRSQNQKFAVWPPRCNWHGNNSPNCHFS